MKKYFVNPELKISSNIIFAIMIVFFIINCFVLKMYHDDLKKDYIKSMGAVTAKVIEKDPELEDKIIPFITHPVSAEEADKAKIFLNKYGLNDSLENSLFPYIDEISKEDTIAIAVIFALLTFIIFIFNYIEHAYFYTKIRSLTAAAKAVVEGNYNITISEDKEGDLSKLAISFNSMRKIIRNNISELEKEKQFLADLLSDISHQLKTPLSSMIIYNDIMLEKDLSIEQRKTLLQSNQNQLNRMTWLIQSLLKLARLDAKALKLDKQDLSLNETIQESIDSLESKAAQNNVKIHFTEDKEIYFEHDSLWLQEALINIIKNAIEHTKINGKINILLTENPIYIKIEIDDNGEGISKDDLPNIFKRFYKAKSCKRNDSIGIGLALAKSIIEAHNGLIQVKSHVGIGTKFTITFLKY